MYLQAGGGNAFSFGAAGDMWCAQFGDLNTRIESRASAYAENARVNAYNAAYGDAVQWAANNCINALRIVESGSDYGNSTGDDVFAPTYGSFIVNLVGLGTYGAAYGLTAQYRRAQAKTWNSGWFDY